MQVLERAIPWWRKALKFALGGIRSGFGLFAWPARLAPVAVPVFSGGFKQNPEEERALTKASPKIEMTAPAMPAARGAERGSVAAQESEPDRVKGEAGATREIPEEASVSEQAAEKGHDLIQTPEKHPPGPKGHVDFEESAARLKSCPDTKPPFETRSTSFPAGCEAGVESSAPAAQLKSCPDTPPVIFAASEAENEPETASPATVDAVAEAEPE